VRERFCDAASLACLVAAFEEARAAGEARAGE
jgi:hypothetical protein